MNDTAPVFTKDWFSNNIPRWTELFKPRGRFFKKRVGGIRDPVHWLELGAFEGRSALWAVDNVLSARPGSSLTCVDRWQNEAVFRRFRRNLADVPVPVTAIRATTRDALVSPEMLGRRFDVVYVDADHHSAAVLQDAVLVFPLLKPGGIIIFDDYTDNPQHDSACPRSAIDAFVRAYAGELDVVTVPGWQMVVRKRQVPVPRKPCRSRVV